MTTITSGTAGESRRSVDPRPLASSLMPIAAVALAVAVAYTGWSVLTRVEFLLTWNDSFSGSGVLTVVGCQPEPVFGPDRWRCEGRLGTAEADEVDADLIVGKDALLSSRPYVGQQVQVFYDPAPATGADEPRVVFARDAQLSELARLYLALPPLLMILVGAAGSLLGVAVDQLGARSSKSESWWRTSPLLLDLRRRGAIWLVVGLATLGLYHLLVRAVLGSAGVA